MQSFTGPVLFFPHISWCTEKEALVLFIGCWLTGKTRWDGTVFPSIHLSDLFPLFCLLRLSCSPLLGLSVSVVFYSSTISTNCRCPLIFFFFFKSLHSFICWVFLSVPPSFSASHSDSVRAALSPIGNLFLFHTHRHTQTHTQHAD